MTDSTFFIYGLKFRYTALAFYLLLCTLHVQASDPIAPNTMSCSPGLGNPLNRWACEIAMSEIPHAGTLRTFSTKAKSSEHDEWIELPQRFTDNDFHPDCEFTVELEGHSKPHETVEASHEMTRKIAINLLDNCVFDKAWGGWETFGLDRTFRALIPPTPYDQLAMVENPDGMVNSVALPENSPGFSESPQHVYLLLYRSIALFFDTSVFVKQSSPHSTLNCNPNNSPDVPLYMIVTVSGPRVHKLRERTDYAIGSALTR